MAISSDVDVSTLQGRLKSSSRRDSGGTVEMETSSGSIDTGLPD
jgi:hypothetical protein